MTVRITCETGDPREFDLVVVACDPRELTKANALAPTDDEAPIFDGLENYFFRTRLLRAKKPGGYQKHGVIFSPTRLQKMDGGFYAFRNETAKQHSLPRANRRLHDGEANLVTTYQISRSPMTAAEFDARFESDLAGGGVPWWTFESYEPALDPKTGEPVELLVPYFSHFTSAALRDRAPWKLWDLQGKNRTLYVHAFACFESVLHIWQYIEALFARDDIRLPWKDRPIAIIGAGVSGLLVARKLRKLGFDNLTLFEKSTRFGGKTRTVKIDDVVCELGTCYMSPAYDPLVEELEPYLHGNDRFDFALWDNDPWKRDENFRAVATEDQFSPRFGPVDDVLAYDSYSVKKAADYWVREKALANGAVAALPALLDVLQDVAGFSTRHRKLMGEDRPMPFRPPTEVLEKDETFGAFLERTGMGTLVGALQFAYSVQGYGILDAIPAYYGMLWVTPEVMDPIRNGKLTFLNPHDDTMVSAWRKGWGDIWRQLVEKEKLDDNIEYGAKVTRIERLS